MVGKKEKEVLHFLENLVEERNPRNVEYPMTIDQQFAEDFPDHTDQDSLYNFLGERIENIEYYDTPIGLIHNIDTINYSRAWNELGEHLEENAETYNNNPLHWASIIADASIQITGRNPYFQPMLLETYMAVPEEESNINWKFGPSGLSEILTSPDELIDDFITDLGDTDFNDRNIRKVGILTTNPKIMAEIIDERIDDLNQESKKYSEQFRSIFDEAVESTVNYYLDDS